MNLGWECPRCHIIHAPSVTRCDACVGGIPSPTTGPVFTNYGDLRCRCGLYPTQTCSNVNCYRNSGQGIGVC